MDDTIRCQSCGMPISDGFYGTNKDHSENNEYCKFCFEDGAFTQPNLTLAEMIHISVENMTKDLKMPEEKALELANSVIPKLKRWQ